MSALRTIDAPELAQHNSDASCWIALYGTVYDVTSFLSEHPGGAKVLRDLAGKDGTLEFEEIHDASIIARILPRHCMVGMMPSFSIDSSNVAEEYEAKRKNTVPIDHLLNVFDMEAEAHKVMSKAGWDYYSSGADDEVTLRENHTAFHRIWLKPRVLVDVSNISTKCSMLGSPSDLPVYVTATALAKLADPEGEVAITRACASKGVIQMIPTLSSRSLTDIIQAKTDEQIQWFQLYVNSNRELCRAIIKQAEDGGCKVLCVTVDAPQLGRRERDMRNKFDLQSQASLQKGKILERKAGAATALTSFIDPSLSWKDIKWIKTITNMKIVLKGIQCSEDALLANDMNIDGIILSNHGGRQLDFARSAIEILPEVVQSLKQVNSSMEVYIDGGIRRGNDIFKALALGATAVGIGRPAIYGLAAYGQEGVEVVLDMLKHELANTMRNMGTPTIKDIQSSMIMYNNLTNHYSSQPKSMLPQQTYFPLQTAAEIHSRL